MSFLSETNDRPTPAIITSPEVAIGPKVSSWRNLCRHWSRQVASDLVLLSGVVGSSTAVWAVTHAFAPALSSVFPSYLIISALLVFGFRSSVDLFAAGESWMKLALVGLAAMTIAIVLTGSMQGNWPGVTWWLALTVVATVPLAAVHRAAGWIVSREPVAALFRSRVAIYGATEQSLALHVALLEASSDHSFIGLFDDRQNPNRIGNSVTPIIGSMSTLVRLVRNRCVDDVIICLPQHATARMREVTNKMTGYPVSVWTVAHLDGLEQIAASSRSNLRFIGTAGLIRIHVKPIRGWGLAFKEALDRVGASVLLLVLAPIFAIVAAIIKIDSKGSVFFRQRRHGLMGHTIIVWKFRTMNCAEDGNSVQQARKNDPRVTKVGAVLRKTSLDELPQLINVFRGEMSLVGPRPHAIAHNEHYGALIERYDHRNMVKPGITGWAQINGFRGETTAPEQMEKRVEHDLAYIGKWSLWLDIKVLLLTPIYGFINRNAF